VFVVASVSKLHPQRLQVMVVTAPIIAPFCAVERLFSVKSHKVLTLFGLVPRRETTVREAYSIRSAWLRAHNATAFGGDILFPGDFRQELTPRGRLEDCRLSL